MQKIHMLEQGYIQTKQPCNPVTVDEICVLPEMLMSMSGPVMSARRITIPD